MTAKKVMKLFTETVEVSDEPGPAGFGDMTLAEKRKSLIAWIQTLTGEDEEETPDAANNSTDAETPVSEEAVAEEASEGPTGEVGGPGNVGVEAKATDTKAKAEEKSEETVSDKEDKTSAKTADEPETSEKPKQPAEKEKPAEKATDTKAVGKKAKPKAKTEVKSDGPDPIHDLAKEIETINDLLTVESKAIELLQRDKVNEFQMGGYPLRLQNSDE